MNKKKALYLYGVCKGAGLSLTIRALYRAKSILNEEDVNVLVTICLHELRYKQKLNPGIKIDELNKVLKSTEKISQSDFKKLAMSCFQKAERNKKVDRYLSKFFLTPLVIKPENYKEMAKKINCVISKVLKLHKEAVYIYAFAEGYGMPELKKGVFLANKLHLGQKRKDGRDFIEHPIEGVRYLINLGLRNPADLSAEALHDTLEDCPEDIDYEELVRIMGKIISLKVKRVTRIKGQSEEEYRRQYNKEVGTVLIKAADRTSNICDMVLSYNTDKLEYYTIETEEGILPDMKKARNLYPEYSDIFITLRDRIKTVLIPVKEVIKLRRRVEKLRLAIIKLILKVNFLMGEADKLRSENEKLKRELKNNKK